MLDATLDFIEAKCMIKASSIHLFVINEQRPSVSTPDAHSFAQQAQFRVVLLFVPNLRKRLPIFQLKIEFFGETESKLEMHMQVKRCVSLTLETLPMARHTQGPVLLLLRGSKSISIQMAAGICHLSESCREI
jgi:hypothetical protein